MPTRSVISLPWCSLGSWWQSRQETRPCILHNRPIAWLGRVSMVSKGKESAMTIFRHFKTQRMLETSLEITLYLWGLLLAYRNCSISQVLDRFQRSASRLSSRIRTIRLSNNLVSTSYLQTRSIICRESTWSWLEKKIRSSMSSIPMHKKMLNISNFHQLSSWMLILTLCKVFLSPSRRRISSWCKR